MSRQDTQVRRTTPAPLPSVATTALCLTRPDRRVHGARLSTNRPSPPARLTPTATAADITELDLNSSTAPCLPDTARPIGRAASLSPRCAARLGQWRRCRRRAPPLSLREGNTARRGGLSGARGCAAPAGRGRGSALGLAGWGGFS